MPNPNSNLADRLMRLLWALKPGLSDTSYTTVEEAAKALSQIVETAPVPIEGATTYSDTGYRCRWCREESSWRDRIAHSPECPAAIAGGRRRS